MWRRLVAAVGHAPGLWLVYRERLPKEMWRANAAAVVATGIAIVLAAVMAPSGLAGVAALSAWLVGHGLWGAYLFVKLPAAPARPSPSGRPMVGPDDDDRPAERDRDREITPS